MNYYWTSEKRCAYYALKELVLKLPDRPDAAATTPEYGTTIFRWEVPGSHDPIRYSFQKPVYKGTKNHWRPLGKVPSGTEEWAHCHTHPNDGFFSKDDTEWALGNTGFLKIPFVIYMVNRKGAYWFDGRSGFQSKNQRYGLFWGAYPS
ncbi:hypothetical protein FMN50_26965 [Rhodobacterales bacterium]|nr:hypothetical protein FMN50_26965 [Rhodobacterales bacterium]